MPSPFHTLSDSVLAKLRQHQQTAENLDNEYQAEIYGRLFDFCRTMDRQYLDTLVQVVRTEALLAEANSISLVDSLTTVVPVTHTYSKVE